MLIPKHVFPVLERIADDKIEHVERLPGARKTAEMEAAG